MIDNVLSLFITRWQTLRKSTLYMNAFFLMLSTFTLAASGLLFWLLVTQAYDAVAVGLATTLISTSGLLALLGLAGFDTTFVRFLPNAERKNDYINSGYIIVSSLSVVLAAVLGAVLPWLSPSFSILSNPWVYICFVLFTVATSLSLLTNAVFLAFKHARYIFIINAVFGALKVALVLLVAQGNAITIFAIVGGTQIIGLVLGIVWMKRVHNYRFAPRIHVDVVRAVRKFSFSVYASSILNLLPPTLLPLLIVYQVGLEDAAYYYMAFTIASVLYTIAYASMQSMFAEGSHDESAMHAHVKKAAKLIVVLLLPATILTLALSSFLLTIFGPGYAAKGTALLQLFAIGALPVAVYSAMGAIFKVTKNLAGVIGMNVTYAVVILGLSFWLVPVWGLVAVGWAWIIGNILACGIGALFLIKNNKR